jgi:hypothetical protein
MLSCKPVDTPISTSQTTILPDPLFSDATRFRKIVGALQYLTFTRPNICFAVNRVCHFMHAPTYFFWDVVKHILRYLKDTTTHGLHITLSSSFALHGFTYADWVMIENLRVVILCSLVRCRFHGNKVNNV